MSKYLHTSQFPLRSSISHLLALLWHTSGIFVFQSQFNWIGDRIPVYEIRRCALTVSLMHWNSENESACQTEKTFPHEWCSGLPGWVRVTVAIGVVVLWTALSVRPPKILRRCRHRAVGEWRQWNRFLRRNICTLINLFCSNWHLRFSCYRKSM